MKLEILNLAMCLARIHIGLSWNICLFSLDIRSRPCLLGIMHGKILVLFLGQILNLFLGQILGMILGLTLGILHT